MADKSFEFTVILRVSGVALGAGTVEEAKAKLLEMKQLHEWDWTGGDVESVEFVDSREVNE